MRLICQEVDALAVLQLYKFSDERLLTGVSLNYRPRPEAVFQPCPTIPRHEASYSCHRCPASLV